MKKKNKVFYLDLAANLPPDITRTIGHLTILFGRLEHMVLLSIKRIEGISLRKAQNVHGKKPLGPKVEVLQSYSDKYKDLNGLCVEIKSLNKDRIELIHGLIGYVTVESEPTRESPSLITKGKILDIEEKELWKLEDKIIDVIVRLNERIPIPGLEVSVVSGGEINVTYDETAVNSDDPLVEKASIKKIPPNDES